MKRVVVLIHPIQAEISVAEVQATITNWEQTAIILSIVVLERTRDAWSKAPESWKEVVIIQRAEVEDKLSPLLKQNPDVSIAYFGLAPIPLIIDLAVGLGSSKPTVVFQKHHRRNEWLWLENTFNRSAPIVEGLPARPLRMGGDIVLRVSTSALVAKHSTSPVVRNPTLEIEVRTDKQDIDAFESLDDVKKFAEEVHRVVTALTSLVPAKSKIHLFAAVQCGVAFAIGTRLERTRHHPIQTYQFSAAKSPQYQRAIEVNSISKRRSISWLKLKDFAQARPASLLLVIFFIVGMGFFYLANRSLEKNNRTEMKAQFEKVGSFWWKSEPVVLNDGRLSGSQVTNAALPATWPANVSGSAYIEHVSGKLKEAFPVTQPVR